MTIDLNLLAHNYQQVLENIANAAELANRNPEDVRLVVVTKGHPLETIERLIEIGVRDFGENRVEEAQTKISKIAASIGVRWHMIGHLQSRKASLAAENFSLVHSIDRMKIANRLNNHIAPGSQPLEVLLQFNLSGEATKSGWDAVEDGQWDALCQQIEPVLSLPNLKVVGMMTMAPYGTNPEDARPIFSKLARLRDHLARNFNALPWQELSMGMSDDYQVAVEEGATLVRVGTAVLGPRNYKMN